jgi:hypothetical protein
MNVNELSGDQIRQIVDTQQVYEAYLETAELLSHSYAGSMRFVSRKGREYLLHKTKYTEKSLGPRDKNTQKIYDNFISGRAMHKERLNGMKEQLKMLSRINKAMGLGRVPEIAARILRRLDEASLLGNKVTVAGTNALYAYEALAGVRVSTDLVASGDIDLLYDTRRSLKFSISQDLNLEGVIGVLKRADRSFTSMKSKYQAVNKHGYYVDFISPLPKNVYVDNEDNLLSSFPNDLESVGVEGLEEIINAPKRSVIALDEKGYPVRFSVADPRVYALHKIWLSNREDREPQKAKRDRYQGYVAALIAQNYLGLDFEAKDLSL